MIKVTLTNHVEIMHGLVDGVREKLSCMTYIKNNKVVCYFILFINCSPNGLMKTKTFYR